MTNAEEEAEFHETEALSRSNSPTNRMLKSVHKGAAPAAGANGKTSEPQLSRPGTAAAPNAGNTNPDAEASDRPSTASPEFVYKFSPEAFQSLGLPSLRILDISGNSLGAVPGWLPVGLEQLFLDYNCIETIPDWLCDSLPDLRVLSLHHNRVHSLPPNMENMSNLRAVALGGNPCVHPDVMLSPSGPTWLLTEWLYRVQLDSKSVHSLARSASGKENELDD